MSGQRYVPSPDRRSSRDQSPPWNRDRNTTSDLPGIHPSRAGNFDSRSTPQNSGPGLADVPKGPKALAERSYAPPTTSARGWGLSNRPDARSDYRERVSSRAGRVSPPPPSDDRDRAWRDRDLNARRERRSSPSWSSHHDSQDRRDQFQPREYERAPARHTSRDVPPAGAQGTHPRPADNEPSYRGDPSRGRGRDWSFRSRDRASYNEDRPPLRNRSPSPRSARWDREDAWSANRTEERVPDRRSSEKGFERDDRDTTSVRYAKDQVHSSQSSRRVDSASNPLYASAAGQQGHLQSTGRPIPDADWDVSHSRRPISRGGPPRPQDYRQDDVGLDYGDSKPFISKESYSSRPSSPPRPPEIPAFGSIATKPAPMGQPGSTRQPVSDSKARQSSQIHPPPPPPPPPPATQEQNPSIEAPRLAPSAPKADLDRLPPTGPKASRFSDVASLTDRKEPANLSRRDNTFIPGTGVSASNPTSFTPHSQSVSEKHAYRNVHPSQSLNPTSPASKQPQVPPIGPRATTMLSKKASTQAVSPTLSAPSGPRGISAHATGSALGINVPTGPKAIRNKAPQAPRAAVPQSSASTSAWHWKSGQASSNVIPAKRSLDGTQRLLPDNPSDIRNDVKLESLPKPSFNTQNHLQPPMTMNDQSNPTSGFDGSPKTDRLQNIQPSVEEDDAMDLDEGDIAMNEEKFERDKAILEAKLIDLSSRYLRGASPLENLGLLGRIALEDFPSFFQQTRVNARSAAPAKPDADTPAPEWNEGEMPTPGEETKEYVLVDRTSPPRISPSPVGSPELRSLPFLEKEPLTPLSDLEAFQSAIARHETFKKSLEAEVKNEFQLRSEEEVRLREEFRRLFRIWRPEVDRLDKLRHQAEGENQENADGNINISVAPEVSPVVPNSATDSNRRSRGAFASELDLARIMQESIETEREAQAKRDREVVSTRPDEAREANIPDMLSISEQNACDFVDASHIQDSSLATDVFELLPPEDTFTKEEHETLVQNFKEFPKKFGKLAQALPGRTYKDCINHYYATKWNHEFKPPRMKNRPKYGRSRARANGPPGRPKPNALISNLDGAKPDVYDGEETTAPLVAVTDSGRPRRAAAPIWPSKEMDEQVNNGLSPAKRGTKAEASTDVNEKSMKKPRAPAKDKPPRKPRNQTIIRQPSLSPSATSQDYNSRITDVLVETEQPPNPVVGVHSNQVFQQYTKPDTLSIPMTEFQLHPESSAGPMESVKTSNTQSRAGPSSYWSVQEVTSFPGLLGYFGTDWASIANHMGTKSQTMVKNYYGRLMNTNDASDIERIARQADERKERGIAIGPPPSNASSAKRKPEPTPLMSRRALAPSNEVIEVEDESPPVSKPPRDSYMRPQMATSSFPGYSQTLSMQNRSEGGEPFISHSTTSMSTGRGLYGQQSPPQGLRELASDKSFARSTASAAHQPTSDSIPTQIPSYGKFGVSVPETSQSLRESREYHQRPGMLFETGDQKVNRSPRQVRETNQFPVTQTGPNTVQLRQPPANVRSIEEARYPSAVRQGDFPQSQSLFSRPAEVSPTPNPAKPIYDAARHPNDPRGSQDHGRLPSGQSNLFNTPPTNPRPEVRNKKSNLMDILNAEPADSRPSRSLAAPPSSSAAQGRTRTPPPQYAPYPPQRPPSQLERRELGAEPQRHSSYQPTFTPASQTTNLSRQSSDNPALRETHRPSEPSRPEWLSRPTYTTPSYDKLERSPAFGHRASLQTLNTPHNPSPPPTASHPFGAHSTYGHSRDGSVTSGTNRQHHEPHSSSRYTHATLSNQADRPTHHSAMHEAQGSSYSHPSYLAPQQQQSQPSSNPQAHGYNAASQHGYQRSSLRDGNFFEVDSYRREQQQQQRERELQLEREQRARMPPHAPSQRPYSPFR